MKKVSITLALVLSLASSILAPSTASANNDDHYQRLAVERLYEGGVDEQDLKVQEELFRPRRTVDLTEVRELVIAQIKDDANGIDRRPASVDFN